MRRGLAFIATTLTLASAAAKPDLAVAHGLQLVGRQDLPVPSWLFGWAAAAVLIASFAILAASWREPRFEADRWHPLPAWTSRSLLGSVARAMAGGLGVLLLALVIWSGFSGSQIASTNFTPTFVFVTFWLGLVPLSLLFGDVFRAFNPWWTLARVFGWVFKAVAGQSRPPLADYPERLGIWPAALGILGFVWLELVYGFAREGISPDQIATATVGYSVVTGVGMFVFGARTWVERGEAFSVYFGLLGRLSPVQIRNGRLGIQPPLIGVRDWGFRPGSVALVCVVIGATVYDGSLESLLGTPLRELSDALVASGIGLTGSLRLAGSLLLGACVLLIAAVYRLGIAGMSRIEGSLPPRQLASLFAHTLVPIAVAYLVAHYFSFFVFAEQLQFTTLLSDPLGRGWDLLGGADATINYGAIGANTVWYVQVGVLIVGHVLALVLAHERALVCYPSPRAATRSQYPMLVVMVVFTVLGLYLLSQGNQ